MGGVPGGIPPIGVSGAHFPSVGGTEAPRSGRRIMVDDELSALLIRADQGDTDARDQLVELAGERGDAAILMRLAKGGNSDAAGVHIELASERGDLETLREL